jgi:hypothetical protein
VCGGRTVETKRPWINAKLEGLRSKGSYFGVAPDAAHRALILADDELMKAWLDPSISPAEGLSLCEPLAAERMSSEIRPLGQANADAAQAALPMT